MHIKRKEKCCFTLLKYDDSNKKIKKKMNNNDLIFKNFKTIILF